jgi:hypothetical protein
VNREPGWYGDPYFRNRERYWDGEIWTDQVRETAVGSTPATPAPRRTPTSGTSSPPGDSAPDAARPIPLGVITAPGPSSTAQGQGGPGRRRGLVIAVVALVVLAAVGVGVILSGGGGSSGGSGGKGGGGGGTASATGVAGAVEKTLHRGTVAAAVDVKVSSPGGSALQQVLSGAGQFDLKNQTGTMSLVVPGVAAQEGTTPIVFVGPTVYVYLGPRLSALVPGKTWISATEAELGSPGSGLSSGISAFEQLIGNPTTLVSQLNGGGVRFTSLGASSFDGASVQRYLVKFPSSGTTSTSSETTSTVSPSGAHGGEDLYVSAKGLIRAVVIPVEVASNGQTFHETITIAFTHYGQPVTVAPPPAAQVATLAQYQAALDQSGQTATPGVTPSPNVTPTNGPAVGTETG